MNKQYRLRIEIINLVIRFMIFFTLTSFILFSITDMNSYIWKSLMLFPAAIISFLIGKYSNNILIFIILHLVLLVAYIVLGGVLILSIAYGINIIAYAITEFVIGINKKIKNTPSAFSLIFIAMYALCRIIYPMEKLLGSFFFSITIAFGLLYIINMYFVNSYIYFKKHEEKANIPMKKIQSMNIFYIGGFLLLSYIVMKIFSRIPLAGVGSFLRGILVKFIKFLISTSMLILKKPEEITLEEEVSGYKEVLINPEPTLFSNIVNAIFGGLAVLIILAIIIYGLYRIYKLFYSNVVIVDEARMERITPFVRNGNKPAKNPSARTRISTLFDRSNNVKIRRQYIRAVQRHRQSDKVVSCMLPKELSEYALGSGRPNMDEASMKKKKAELTAVYEKARYSNIACTKEEVKLIKEILKQK